MKEKFVPIRKFDIVAFKAKEFAKSLPKNKITYLQGVHQKKPCYYAWKNGKMIGIIFDIKAFVKSS